MILPLTVEATIYIIAFLVGSIGSTLAAINNIKHRTVNTVLINIFMITLLFYCVFNMLLCFFMDSVTYQTVFNLMIIASNICYFIYVIIWLIYIDTLQNNNILTIKKRIIAVTAVYAVLVETVVVIRWNIQFSDISYDTLLLSSRIVMLLNAAFTIFMIICGLRRFISTYRNQTVYDGKKISRISSLIFVLYMVWMTYWDLSSYDGGFTKIKVIVGLDPIIFLFFILCCKEIKCFYIKYLKNNISHSSALVDNDRLEEATFKILKEKFNITKREMEIIDLIEQGYSNSAIGQNLFISENTVKKHTSNIFFKTGTTNRYELIHLISEEKKNVEIDFFHRTTRK